MYPNLKQVNEATHLELCRWYRFLPSPGSDAINKGRKAFDIALSAEALVMTRICERVKELGGFTPAISKEIGF